MPSERSATWEDSELTSADFHVEHLPGKVFTNPMLYGADGGLSMGEDQRVLYQVSVTAGALTDRSLAFRAAGLRRMLHFNPATTTVGIVSCGGLCPGLNDVIKSVVYQALDKYGVQRVIGFRYGFYGLTREGIKHSMILDQQVVATAHLSGGSILGTSRGPQDTEEMVDTLAECKVNVLICIGGDGTQRGAKQLVACITRRDLDIAVVGVPKTIDNDIPFVEHTFGFDTAVQEAVKAIKSALYEARSLLYGIGLVKLMGRNAGFIAAQATLASQAAHICLIPEQPVPFETLCDLIAMRFTLRTYCVIVVAEGFGQDLVDTAGATDASGNRKLGDIGIFLRDHLRLWLKVNKDKYGEAGIKYIDPSYTTRSCPASSHDSAFCVQLANCALHEGMHGATNCVLGHWAGCFTTVPIPLATRAPKRVDLKGNLWCSVRENTVSRRRRTVGAPDEERDLVNAAVAARHPDNVSRAQHLWHKVHHLHHLKAHDPDQDVKRPRKDDGPPEPNSNSTAGSPAPDGPTTLLEHLELKYAQMKEVVL